MNLFKIIPRKKGRRAIKNKFKIRRSVLKLSECQLGIKKLVIKGTINIPKVFPIMELINVKVESPSAILVKMEAEATVVGSEDKRAIPPTINGEK